MLKSTVSALLDLNRQFYQTFAQSFAETRRRVQPGVRRMLGRIPGGDWLDIGCGSGALALEWVQAGKTGLYHGLDFSPGLLEVAQQVVLSEHPELDIRFGQADLSDPDWDKEVQSEAPFDGVLAFATLHHLPSKALRLSVLRQVAELIEPGGWFIHSEWQFQNSQKLLARVLPWNRVGLTDLDVEEGDTLLDWRHPQPGQSGIGLRYVHQFTLDELERLAHGSGFAIRETFESDGEGGKLGLYQVWQKQF